MCFLKEREGEGENLKFSTHTCEDDTTGDTLEPINDLKIFTDVFE